MAERVVHAGRHPVAAFESLATFVEDQSISIRSFVGHQCRQRHAVLLGEPRRRSSELQQRGREILEHHAGSGDVRPCFEARPPDDQRHAKSDVVRPGFRTGATAAVLAVMHPIVAGEDHHGVREHVG